MYNVLRQPLGLEAPTKDIWRSMMPAKASFLLWLIHFGKALTLDNIQKKGMQIANRCCLCRQSEETVSHLFLHYSVTKDLWGEFLQRVCIRWVCPETFPNFLCSWFQAGSFFSTGENHVAMLPSCDVLGIIV